FAVGATAYMLADSAPALVVLGAEIAAAAAALGVCIRCCPTPAVRTELWSRLSAAGLIGTAGGARERVLQLVLGPRQGPVRGPRSRRRRSCRRSWWPSPCHRATSDETVATSSARPGRRAGGLHRRRGAGRAGLGEELDRPTVVRSEREPRVGQH